MSADTASEARPSDRSNAMRRFVMGYEWVSLPRLCAVPARGTDNISVVAGQDAIVLFQDLGQSGIIRCFSLLQQAGEGHYALVVIAESLDKSFQALLCSALVAGAET